MMSRTNTPTHTNTPSERTGRQQERRPRRRCLSLQAARADGILSGARSLRLLVDSEREQARDLREMATGTRCAFTFTGYARPNPESRTERAVAALLELEERWARDAAELAAREAAIGRAFARMDAQDALLLQLRYLRGMTWEGIARRLYVDERTARRHQQGALERFMKAYEETDCDSREGRCRRGER